MTPTPAGSTRDGGWQELPAPWPTTAGWAHADIAMTPDGGLVTCHPDGGALVLLSADGTVTVVAAPITEAHGISVLGERLWLADVGSKYAPDSEGRYGEAGPGSGQVLQLDLTGAVTRRLDPPPRRSTTAYLPTSVVEDEHGNVWVADGYGASEVHRYDRDGVHLDTMTGEEHAIGHLDCPHALHLDRRRSETELYVADRARHRLVVFGLDGSFRREVAGLLHLPSALTTYGDLLLVVELHGRVTVLDADDQVVSRSGADPENPQRTGWPNGLTADGRYGRAHDMDPAALNSPHGLAIDGSGRVVVAEWVIGGRLMTPSVPLIAW